MNKSNKLFEELLGDDASAFHNNNNNTNEKEKKDEIENGLQWMNDGIKWIGEFMVMLFYSAYWTISVVLACQ